MSFNVWMAIEPASVEYECFPWEVRLIAFRSVGMLYNGVPPTNLDYITFLHCFPIILWRAHRFWISTSSFN